MDTTIDLPTPLPTRRRLSRIRHSVFGALAAIALLASACGDGDASSGNDRADDSGDAESGFSDATTDAEAGFSGDDSGVEAGVFEEPDRSDAEGLFDRRDEPDPDRLDDNFFEDHGVRPFVDADEDNLSTFALDVDTASFTVARRWLAEGVSPDPASVRVEEFVNAFDYDYRPPRRGLSLDVDGAPSPYDDADVLVRIGVQAAEIDEDERPPAALTFVVDTSGSMDRDDRLGLVKEALEELVDELDRDDTVAIVTYGNDSAVVLEPTAARDDDEILDAIDDLRPGGSTNMEAGLETGYELAEAAFVEDGINRVILASDGVANVGLTDPDRLTERITERATAGIQLVTVGFGMGNFNDTLMEQLADQGDGFYAYVDDRDEAERLFEDELAATLAPVALDARIQVEFDADVVDEYRLLGFENRGLLDRDFRDERVDAGELSSGHTVTALYELDLHRGTDRGDDLGQVTLRWMSPVDGGWDEVDADIELRDVADDWRETEADLRLATVVAVWAEILRDSPFADNVDLDDVAREAERLHEELDTDQSEELADLTRRSAELG